MLSRLLPACFTTAFVLVTLPARAGGAEDEARKLFEEGSAAEKRGQAAEACAKFRQSLGLVREVGPLLKAKDCDLREGKLVSAEASLRELIARWPEPGPELEALKTELATVEKRVPRLTLKLRDGAPGVSVRLDGAAVDFPADGRAVDPGKHELSIEVPDRPIERIVIELADGERKTIELPSRAPDPVKPPPPPPEASSGLGALGIVGIVVGALGVGGFVGAGVTGKLVLDKHDEFESARCSPDQTPPAAPGCAALAEEGDTLLVANGVLWGVGIAGVAVGATLLIVDLVGSSNEPTAPNATLGARPGYVELTVRF
jgi:hypothetical protein